ncbi:pectate lyase A-like [Bradysia coprophila]|uniref:pectate lyase A-like n=1 Tax=Bradysia coprophila TaxID=38358 RepID=UPI00187D6F03|nr:pectate lyase A-like [Bradysia coprophila]
MALKVLLLLTVTILLFQSVRSQIGFATLNGGTNGGAGGPTVTVSTEADLLAAVQGNDRRIIRITANIRVAGRVRVGSNKSILGATANAGITNGGLFIVDAENVIVRGLFLSFPVDPFDCIEIQRSSRVWVDHNELFSNRNNGRDFYDGLFDINHGSDLITASWNHFHTHYKVSLIGNSDDNGSVDSGRLRVSFHHNRFRNLNSRVPSLRFGTAHLWNNLFEDIDSSTINSRMGAQVLVENNIFINVRRTIITNLDSREDGFANERNNDWGVAHTLRGPFITRTGTFTSAPYSYQLDNGLGANGNIATIVRNGAGKRNF